MRLPFTIDQFLDAFRRYNAAVWPAQWVLVLLAIVAIVLALRDRPNTSRGVSGILAVLWLWMAFAYHVAFFTSVSRVGVVFGAAFALQGFIFAWLALHEHSAVYRPSSAAAGVIGALLITYALVGYPVLAYLLGHRYPAAPTFGVPCPTTIFTLGLIAWSNGSMPTRLLVIPLAWTIVGMSAAANLGMTEDFGLLAAAIASVASFVVARRRRSAGDSTKQSAAPNADRWTVVY